MSQISANDLKTKGISAIEFALSSAPEAIVSVRGKDKFVVMDVACFHYLRECELDAALAQTRADLGRWSRSARVARSPPGAAGRAVSAADSPRMPFALVFTEQYNRRAARFLKRHPELRHNLSRKPSTAGGQPGAPVTTSARFARQV